MATRSVKPFRIGRPNAGDNVLAAADPSRVGVYLWSSPDVNVKYSFGVSTAEEVHVVLGIGQTHVKMTVDDVGDVLKAEIHVDNGGTAEAMVLTVVDS